MMKLIKYLKGGGDDVGEGGEGLTWVKGLD